MPYVGGVWRDPTSINDLKELNRRVGKHFFDRDTMKHWNSIVYSRVIPIHAGWLFITSEQFVDRDRRDPRKFTVRKMLEHGDVVTVGEFQAHDTYEEAEEAAYLYARNQPDEGYE